MIISDLIREKGTIVLLREEQGLDPQDPRSCVPYCAQLHMVFMTLWLKLWYHEGGSSFENILEPQNKEQKLPTFQGSTTGLEDFNSKQT